MLLASYRILDLTGPLGYMAGRVLGDLGADVVKVEPPGGDPARRFPPTIETGDGPQSAYWLAANANKRGVTIDLEGPEGREQLRRLVEAADFVLESFLPGMLDAWGLGYNELARGNPGLIMVSITPFGQEGPYRSFRASDLEITALAGAMSLAGDEDGEPLRVSVPQSGFLAGLEGAMGALTALLARRVTGRGQHVDVSAQMAVIAALANAPAHWDLNGDNPGRTGIYVSGRTVNGTRMRALWPCRDGWITFIIYGGEAGRESNRCLVEWMKEKGLAPDWLQEVDWSWVDVPSLTQADVDRLERPIAEFLATLTKHDFYEGVVARGILGYPVLTVEDIYADPHLQARRFWQTARVATSAPQDFPLPGSFAVVDGERLPLRYPAPRVGEHDEELLGSRSHAQKDGLRPAPT